MNGYVTNLEASGIPILRDLEHRNVWPNYKGQKGVLHVTYEGQKPSVLRAGSYAYGPAKARHEARCANAGPCVLFIAFESPIDAVLTVAAPK